MSPSPARTTRKKLASISGREAHPLINFLPFDSNRFENIHPFADGNGRVGRTLLNYWLMINDYPPAIVYEEDRRAYYDALQVYDEQEDLTPLVQFLQCGRQKPCTAQKIAFIFAVMRARRDFGETSQFFSVDFFPLL